MQTIYRTAPASNFTILANDLINSDIPPTPKAILLYLLSKPVTWQLKTHDLRKQLSLTAYAVKKGLRWLCSAGFAAWTRLKSGHTIWRIFDKPQVTPQEKAAYSPVFTPQVEIPQVAFQPVLQITETETKKETNTPTAPPITNCFNGTTGVNNKLTTFLISLIMPLTSIINFLIGKLQRLMSELQVG